MRGLLGFTLALQNFNAKISAIALLYIVLSSLLVEPIMNYLLVKALTVEEVSENSGSGSSETVIPNSNSNNDQAILSDPSQDFGCFKSCLLNLHVFTLQNWLVKGSKNSRLQGRILQSIIVTENAANFEKLDESSEGHQMIELSQLAYQIR